MNIVQQFNYNNSNDYELINYNIVINKMKHKQTKHHTVGTFRKSNIKIVEIDILTHRLTDTWPPTFLAWFWHFNKKWQG
jgi:hypothetical protein